jgi:hypothetical protein
LLSFQIWFLSINQRYIFESKSQLLEKKENITEGFYQ